MLNKLTYKQRTAAVIGIALLAGVFAYTFSFKKTFTLRNELREKKSMIDNLETVKAQIQQYENILENNTFDLKTDESALQNMILNQVTEFCEKGAVKNKLNITEFMPIHEFALEDKKVRTCSFSVKGNFKHLLLLNEELEKELTNAELSAVEYSLTEKRQKKELIATYYIQNISEI